MNRGSREKITKPISSYRKKYHFDHTRSCFFYLPNEQPDSQALLRLFFHSLPSWMKSNYSSRQTHTFLELYYHNDLEAIIGKNYRHFDFRISFAINQSDKKKILICAGITINDFLGWFCALPFHLLLNAVQPLIIRNMKMQSLTDMA